MHSFFRKFLGSSIIFLAIIGMIFSVLGAVGIWVVRKSVITALEETTQNLIVTFDAASDGLTIVDESLDAASGTLTATVQTTETIAQTLAEFNSIANGIVGIVNLIGDGIEASEPNTPDIAAEVQAMAINLNKVSTSLDEANDVIDIYQESVKNTKTQLETIKQNGPTWITVISVVMTIILVWLATAQVGLVLQGFELIRKQ